MKKLRVFWILALCIAGCSTNEKVEPNNPEEDLENKVSFIGVGDNLIHEMIYREADSKAGTENDGLYDFKDMYQPIKADIQKADLAFINQETILGGDTFGMSGYPTFNSPSTMASDLHDIGFDMVNTASNHCVDKWSIGIENSAATWAQQSDMITAGTYTSQEDRDHIRTIERKGITFAFLAYTYGTNGVIPEHDYNVAYFDKDKITADVAKAKEVSDVILVSAHWGDENVSEVSAFELEYSQLFADLEVDVVIGTHPHVIQSVNWVEGKNGNKMLTVYSLGNFLSGMLEVKNVIGGMISFDFVQTKESNEVRIDNVLWIPTVTHYEGDSNNILETRKNFKVYKLKDYPEESAAIHALQGYENQSVKKSELLEKTKRIVKEIPVDQ